MLLGAENSLIKPVEMDHWAADVEKAAEKTTLARESTALIRRFRSDWKPQATQAAFLVLLHALSSLSSLVIG